MTTSPSSRSPSPSGAGADGPTMETALTVEKLRALGELEANATPGPWEAGRADMQSYDGVTGEPFTNIYADNPDGRLHVGERLPFVVGRVFDESGRNKADAAFVVALRNATPALLSALAALQESERFWLVVANEQGDNLRQRDALLAEQLPLLGRLTEERATAESQARNYYAAASRASDEVSRLSGEVERLTGMLGDGGSGRRDRGPASPLCERRMVRAVRRR
jgi:hypothetical protein